MRSTRSANAGSKRTIDDLPAQAMSLASAVEDRLPCGEDSAAAILEACNKHTPFGPHVWVFVGPSGCGKKYIASQIASWMDAPIATVTGEEMKLGAETLYIANNPSPKLIAAINQLLVDRSDLSNPWLAKTIFVIVDLPIDQKNLKASCGRALTTLGAAFAELAMAIPILPPTTDEHWLRLAVQLLEARRGAGSATIERAAKVVALARDMKSILSTENLLIAIPKA